jgi:hypothetical protein
MKIRLFFRVIMFFFFAALVQKSYSQGFKGKLKTKLTNVKELKQRIMKKRRLLLSVVAAFGLTTVSLRIHAQVSEYSFAQLSGTYTELTSSTVLGTTTENWGGTPSLDAEVYNLNALPFAFSFNGVPYNQIYVSSNGFITFGSIAPLGTNNSPLSDTATYDGAVAAWGGDLNGVFSLEGRTSTISWAVEGTFPNREIVIQWKDFRPAYSLSTTNTAVLDFQIRLLETSNVIRVVYGPSSHIRGGIEINAQRQVGLRGSSNLFPTNVNNRQNGTTLSINSSTSGIANTSIQSFSSFNATPGTHTNGKIYEWTPHTCFTPEGLSSTVISLTDANFSWNASASASSGYDYFVSTVNTAPTVGTSPTGSTTSTSVSLAGLTDSTSYYVWVRSNCGSGNLSNWSVVSSFYTGYCSPPPPDSYDNPFWISAFHTLSCVSNFSYTEGYGTGGYNNQFGNFTASNYAGATTDLAITVSGGFFDSAMTAELAGIAVWIDWNNNFVFETIERVFNTTSYATSANCSFIVPVGTPNGSYRMRVVADKTSSNPTNPCATIIQAEFIDFTFNVVDVPSCFPPTALVTSSLTATGVTVSWTAPTPLPENGYQYIVSTTSGFPGELSNEIAAGATPTGTVAAGVTSLVLTGLIPNTTYYVFVASVCGSTVSSWSNSVTLYTGYCIPAPLYVDGTGITNVDFGTIYNTTGAEPGNYGNYSAQSNNVTQATTATLVITYSTGYPYNTKIWVDWNDDLDFNDVGEEVYVGTSLAADPTTLTATFTVPLTAPPGAHRMRIGGQRDESAVPCSNDVWGSFEDYTLKVITDTCLPPTTFATSYLTATSVTVSWTAPSPAPDNGYQYFVSTSAGSPAVGATPTGTVAAGTTSVVVTGLNANTSYYVFVASVCGTDVSAWSPQIIISGDPPPELNYCAPDITVNSSDEFCGAKVNRTVIYDIPLAQLSGPNFTSTDACYPGYPQVYFNDSIGISWSDLGSEAPTSVYIEYIEGYNEAGLELNATFNGVQNGVYSSGSDIDYIGTCDPVVSYQTLSIENYNVGGINSVTIDLPGSSILGFVENPAFFQGYARVYVIYQGQMDLGSPYFTDNFDGTITTNNAPEFFPIGTTIVTWTATDSGGNTATCDQLITVSDVAPVPDVAVLPEVIGECSVTNLIPPTARDNCAGTIMGTTSTIFPIIAEGSTIVIWSYDDGSGNVSTQTQSVFIQDLTAPVPDQAALPVIQEECSVNSLVAPTATDNCGAIITGATTQLPLTTQGTHVVTWTFDDGKGNTSTQTQQVVIDDVTAPIPDVATLLDVTGECSINTVSPPTATDNCGAIIIGTTTTQLPLTTQGTHVVTWTFDDGKGNVSVQTQNVILDDVTPPLPDLATLPDVLGECSINSIESPTATDNCGAVITGSTTALFPITSEGIHLVTWTFDDGNGNVSTQTQNVVLDDVTAPSTPTVLTIIEECSVTLVAPVASDNCSGNIVGATTTPFPITEQGIHTVIWVFDDGNGNSSSVNQQVIINDFTEPETPVLENVTANCEVILSPPTTTDNCTGLITGATTTVFPVTAPGTTIVMWTFDDGNGNYVLVYQNINITPLEASVSVSGFTLTAQNTNPDVSYQWIDCGNSNAPLIGENGVSFTASESGNYALQVTQNGCTETSECYEISTLGITQALQDKCHIYPNPASSEIFIESKANGTYILQDMNGKMVLEDKFNSGKNKVDLDTIQTGMYILTIYTETSFERIKLSVERQ